MKKTKEEYELALLDINNYNSRYMEVRNNTFFTINSERIGKVDYFEIGFARVILMFVCIKLLPIPLR